MSANISWTNYTIVIILLLAAYYLFIGIRFYLQDLRYFLSNIPKQKTHPSYGELENDTISSDVTVYRLVKNKVNGQIQKEVIPR